MQWKFGWLIGSVACLSGVPDERAQPEPFVPPVACIEVESVDVQFGDVDPRIERGGVIARIAVKNRASDPQTRCGGELNILEFSQIGAPFSVDSIESTIVAAGESADITVRFAPSVGGPAQGRLGIISNDPDDPEVVVELGGVGLVGTLLVSPSDFDFGDPYIGCQVTKEFTLTNVGTASVAVSEIELFTSAPDEWAATLRADRSLPLDIGPYDDEIAGPTESSFVTYQPWDTFRDEAFVSFNASDPHGNHNLTLYGNGRSFGTNTDRFDGLGPAQTDVLIVVDRSEKTSDNLENVEANLRSLADQIVSDGRDARVAVAVADDGCVVGEVGFIDNSMSQADARAAMIEMLDADGSRSAPGALTDQPIAMAKAALSTDNLASGGCNEGLLRANAGLSVVLVTDGSEEAKDEAWGWPVSQLEGVKADPTQVAIHAVTAESPDGCEGAEPAFGLYEATVATGGTLASICAADFVDDLWDGHVAGRAGAGTLDPTRVPAYKTIRVTVDGVLVRSGWTYTMSTGQVTFDLGSEPRVGAVVEVTYEVQGPCN